MRRARFFSVFTLSVSLFCLPLVTFAQDWSGRGRLQGVVVDQNGDPVADAKVTLTLGGPEGNGPPSFTTNDKGKWSYLGLSTGPWTIVIEKEGFLVSEGVAPVSEYQRGKQLETVLKPLSAAQVDPNKLTAEQEAAMAAAQAKAEAQQALLDAGNAAVEANDLATAKTKFQELVDMSEAGAAKTYGLLGVARVNYAEGDVDGAIATLKMALENEPGNVPALKVISSILVDEGRQEEADVYIAQLPQGEKIDPNAFLNQGIEKFNANDIEGALEIFDRVVSDFPDFADVYYYRGLANMNAGNNAQALADFRRLLELDPETDKAGEAQQFIEYLATLE